MDKSAGSVDLSEGELKDAVTNASVTNIATVVQLKAKVAKLRDRARIRIKSLRDFHSAIEKNDLVAVKALLDSTVLEKRFLLNEVDVRDSQRLASLHRAAKLPDHRICSLLIGEGASLDVHTCDGDTPLHLAVRNGNLKFAASLSPAVLICKNRIKTVERLEEVTITWRHSRDVDMA